MFCICERKVEKQKLGINLLVIYGRVGWLSQTEQSDMSVFLLHWKYKWKYVGKNILIQRNKKIIENKLSAYKPPRYRRCLSQTNI